MKNKMPMKAREMIPQACLLIVMLAIVLVCILPIFNVVAISLSSKSAILRSDVTFWPVEFTTMAYSAIFKDPSMITSLLFTIRITVIYTAFAMVLTILLAYPLTKKRLKGRSFITVFVIFTMYFSGGTIPVYLNVKDFGLLDTQWALIVPGLISTYNMIILKSFFSSLPQELEEAAIIDGANDFTVLLRVFLPLSLSSVATLSLFYAVGKWNSFADALYYISARQLQPLQLKLYNIIKGSTSVDVAMMEGNVAEVGYSISESIEAATIIFSTLPILIVYPFVQRYFVKGVTIGAVKG
jgi:ABC-type sugar transport system, permease component